MKNIGISIGAISFLSYLVIFTVNADILSSIQATGDYIQAYHRVTGGQTSDFYDPKVGLKFEGQSTYNQRDFSSYAINPTGFTKTPPNSLLVEGDYSNIYSNNGSYSSMTSLVNPSHPVKESIKIDQNNVRYYEDDLDYYYASLRMAINANALSYEVETGLIPIKRLDKPSSSCSGYDCILDLP